MVFQPSYHETWLQYSGEREIDQLEPHFLAELLPSRQDVAARKMVSMRFLESAWLGVRLRHGKLLSSSDPQPHSGITSNSEWCTEYVTSTGSEDIASVVSTNFQPVVCRIAIGVADIGNGNRMSCSRA